jgi:predicted dehydrogenase
MKTYNIGIIGYGGFGQFLHHCWNKLDSVKIVAVSDQSLDDDDSENFRKYKHWQNLIDNEQIDIVSVATPPAFHAEIACAAMRKNKHVLLEKPIAMDISGAEQILQTQKETGKVITVDHMLRYNPIISAFIQLSHEGTFGKLRHVVVSNYAQDEALPAEHWFWDKQISGGIFVEHGVHFFDIVNALTEQKFTKVYGCSHNRNDKQQDQVSAMVLYNEGLIASYYHSFSGPGFFEQTTIRLMYDLAKVEIEGWMPMNGKMQILVNGPAKSRLDKIPGLQIEQVVPVAELMDISRPEGWGKSSAEAISGIKSGGIAYDVEEKVSATFKIQQTKSEVYAACVRTILLDLITKIEDPTVKLGVTAENAYESLKIAVLADQPGIQAKHS